MKSVVALVTFNLGLVLGLGLVSCQSASVSSPSKLADQNAKMLKKFEVNGWKFYKEVPEMPLPFLTQDGRTLAYRRKPVAYLPSDLVAFVKVQKVAFYAHAELSKHVEYSKEEFTTVLYNELLRERADPKYKPRYTFSVWRSTIDPSVAVLTEKIGK